MKRQPLLIVVTGPTASGKTALAIELARYFGTEIVSADSRQLFRDIPIGTAAPTEEELKQVRHHLLGTLSPDEYYSVAMFEQDALNILKEIFATKDVAILCGGSMMYVDTLLHGIDSMPTIEATTRQYVLSLLEQHGLEGVLAQLEVCDPAYYANADHSNTRRIVHALEVCLQAGAPYSSFLTGKKNQRPFKAIKLMIDWPRELLFERINRRTEGMLAMGLLSEAENAFAAYGDVNALNTVGYKELKGYFNGEYSLEEAERKIARNTRVYAKKQLTWLARDRDVVKLSYEAPFEAAIKAVNEIIDENL